MNAILIKKYYLIFIIFIFLFTGEITNAQSKYWVFLADKQASEFNPYLYFDSKAIERRNSAGISLFDITDFPLCEKYVDLISKNVDSIAGESRWFNALAVYANEVQLNTLQNYDFIKSIEPILSYPIPASISALTAPDSSKIKLLVKQINRMGGKSFSDKGIDGKGLRIAIFDGGFPSVDKSPAFGHIRKEGRIIKTWNFPGKKEFVYDYNNHGTMVLSCIAGITDGLNIGLATGAEFLLARTELNTEYFAEEENWLAALEWADKNGADIINSSLGYTYQRYFPEQMNGKSTLVSRAAALAAKKGILVVNAAGNDGMNSWKKIGAPADADSILTVGGIDPIMDYHISFSSFGPTADKRMKPNVCAFGHVVAAGKSGLKVVDGTSFASPLVAGFAACAWQTNRNLTNMQLLDEIQKSADLYPYFDYAHGFGVPRAEYFTDNEKYITQLPPSFDFVTTDDSIKVVIINSNKITDFRQRNLLLFYNIQDSDGMLDKYFVIYVLTNNPLSFNKNMFRKGQKLNVNFKGYTKSFICN